MWKCRCLSSCLSQVIPSSVENQPGSSLRTEGLIPSFWKELRKEDGLSAIHPMGKLFLRLLPVCAKSWRLPAEETVQGCQPGCGTRWWVVGVDPAVLHCGLQLRRRRPAGILGAAVPPSNAHGFACFIFSLGKQLMCHWGWRWASCAVNGVRGL